jgi:hypothetical protein
MHVHSPRKVIDNCASFGTRKADGSVAMTPELEVLDQLVGGDLSLAVIADLFPDQDRCRQAIGAMLKAGEVCILDAQGQALAAWRYRELEDAPDTWSKATAYRLSITDAGAKRVS